MNNIASTSIIIWETRNWRLNKKAGSLCKDFGLTLMTGRSFVGKLYANERVRMIKELRILFKRKTDRFYVWSLCHSCASDGKGNPDRVQAILETLPDDFELVQIDANFPKKP